MSNVINRILLASLVFVACGLSNAASAQTSDTAPSNATTQQGKPQPAVTLPPAKDPARVAGRTELYCGGFIQYTPAPNSLEVVGGEQEQEKHQYSQGDYIYINAGAQQGIRVGQEFSVIRPRGLFSSKLTKKKGVLGGFTQELGQLRVTKVKDRVSVAVVNTSCEAVLLGDLLMSAPQRVAPTARTEVALDRFSDPSGKQTGHIVLARYGREMVAMNEVVYIDLGAEDQIKSGDYFTIYRPVGKGNITRVRDRESAPGTDSGFEGESFRGGKFSNQATRVTRPNQGAGVFNQPVNSPDIQRRRPPVPRKVVGELVILSVQARTATAIITRNAQEIHTGDFVELQ